MSAFTQCPICADATRACAHYVRTDVLYGGQRYQYMVPAHIYIVVKKTAPPPAGDRHPGDWLAEETVIYVYRTLGDCRWSA